MIVDSVDQGRIDHEGRVEKFVQTKSTPVFNMRAFLLALTAATVAHAGPPRWYNTHRFHAHTRLALDEFCHNTSQCNGNCTWTKAVNGRSPGTNLLKTDCDSLAECQDICCSNAQCKAVIFQNKPLNNATGICHLLNRQYNGSTFVSASDSLVANVQKRSESNCTNTTWTCAPVFEEAAERFASLGVPAYVRHSHTSSEGMLWPTKTAPREGWHPIVQDTNRNFPAEFLSKAAAAGIKVILYHYMKTNAYWAAQKPEWLMRWPNGTAITWARGLGMSPCSEEWQDKYVSQVLELVEMGADAFYFDEFPASWGGDWNSDCKARFQEKYGEEMPVELLPTTAVKAKAVLPVAKDARVQELMSEVTQQYFDKLSAAIDMVRPDSKGGSVALISVYKVPRPDGGNVLHVGGGLYETTQVVHPNRLECMKI